MGYEEWYEWALDVKKTDVNYADLCLAVRCKKEE